MTPSVHKMFGSGESTSPKADPLAGSERSSDAATPLPASGVQGVERRADRCVAPALPPTVGPGFRTQSPPPARDRVIPESGLTVGANVLIAERYGSIDVITDELGVAL